MEGSVPPPTLPVIPESPSVAAGSEPPERGGIPTPVMVVIGAALVAAIGLLLLMPGGSENQGTTLSPIAQAAERTAAVSGARFSGSGGGTVAGGGSMTMHFVGVYNGETDQTSMSADVNVNAAGQSLSMTMDVIQDGLVMYMSSPLFDGQIPNGAHWMKLDLSQFVGDEAQAQTSGAVDGRQILTSLSAAGDATVVGPDRVRGVKTTHYTATIDPAIAAQRMRDQGFEAMAETMEQQPPSSVGVWIDADGMVRRTTMEMSLAMPGQAGSSQTAMTFDYFDFGIKPDIAIPPDSDAFDATAISLAQLEDAG